MGKNRRVGGSGWAGVHGSFVGVARGGDSISVSNNGGKGRRSKKGKVQTNFSLSLVENRFPEDANIRSIIAQIRDTQVDIRDASVHILLLKERLSVLDSKLAAAIKLNK